jgi:hypothetical protein
MSNPRWILLLLALCAVPGLTVGDLAIISLLGALSIVARPHVAGQEPPLWVELGLVGVLSVFVLFQSARGEVWDEPLGQDANRYLKNAWAIGIHAWPLYHPWRGPLHALLTLAIPLPLIPASKALSIGATVLTIPATWWLGRAVLGPRAALIATFLLAFWPDLWWTARFSTPYPLLALLVVVGLGCAARGLHHPAWAVGAALLFTLAIATDLRAQGFAIVVAIVAIAASSGPLGRRSGLALVGAMLAATLASRGLLGMFPVPLEPVSQQVQEHSRLLADIPACRLVAGSAIPTDLLGPCGRHLLVDNLARTQTMAPVSAMLLVGLAGLGVWRCYQKATLPISLLVLPILTLIPAYLMTLVEHRYLMPVLPLAFLLVGSGIAYLGDLTPRPYGLALAPILAAAWVAWPGTIWARANDPVPGKHTFVVPRGTALPITLAARVLAGAPSTDHIVDCATADLQIRLYPRPVQLIGNPKRLSAHCAKLVTDGPDKDERTWILVRAPAERWAGWETLWAADSDASEAARGLVLLRGQR